MDTRDLFDFDNDFTEEEESVFTPKAALKKPISSQALGLATTIEQKVVAGYKSGVTVEKLLKAYNLSTGRLYAILRDNKIPFRGSSNHVGSTKPALVEKKPIPTDKEYIFTSDLAERYGLTSGQVRSYCLVLEDQGYQFNRIQRGQRDARIFNDKDINILDRMIEELRIHSMTEAAVLALYNQDIEPPKVDVKLEGDKLYIHIEKNREWTVEEINLVIDLKEENE